MGWDDLRHSVPKNATATIAAPAIDVYVRAAFFNPGIGECLSPGWTVPGVTFELDGVPLGKATVNKSATSTGTVGKIPRAPSLKHRKRETAWTQLSLVGVADGDHTLVVKPPSGHESTSAAQPSLKNIADRTWRGFFVRLTLKANQLVDAFVFNPSQPWVPVTHAYVSAFNPTSLVLDMKPDFVRTEVDYRVRKSPPTMIVVHHTGGKIISGALNEGISKKGPHYEIDLDGHIVKFSEDDRVTSHAGQSRWLGATGCNEFAIGIEVVNADGDPFTSEQMSALIQLLWTLCRDLNIPVHRIIGHSDCRTSKGDVYLLSDDRATCPGPLFEWTQLESAGLGMIPDTSVTLNLGDWGGFFDQFPSEALRAHDSDSHQKFGGKHRTSVTGAVKALQTDLDRIGYSVKLNGEYDKYTEKAVNRFRRHFFTGTRQGQVDVTHTDCPKIVADLMKGVIAKLPAPPPKPVSAHGSGQHAELEEDDSDHAYGSELS